MILGYVKCTWPTGQSTKHAKRVNLTENPATYLCVTYSERQKEKKTKFLQ